MLSSLAQTIGYKNIIAQNYFKFIKREFCNFLNLCPEKFFKYLHNFAIFIKILVINIKRYHLCYLTLSFYLIFTLEFYAIDQLLTFNKLNSEIFLIIA